MRSQIQITSINILNSKYRILFTLLLYFIIYLCYYSDNIVLCMNENSNSEIPLEAETKSVRPKQNNVELFIERQVNAYVGYAEIIEEQKKQIEEMRQRIEFLEEKYSVYADKPGEILSSNTTPSNSEDDSDWIEEYSEIDDEKEKSTASSPITAFNWRVHGEENDKG